MENSCDLLRKFVRCGSCKFVSQGVALSAPRSVAAMRATTQRSNTRLLSLFACSCHKTSPHTHPYARTPTPTPTFTFTFPFVPCPSAPRHSLSCLAMQQTTQPSCMSFMYVLPLTQLLLLLPPLLQLLFASCLSRMLNKQTTLWRRPEKIPFEF